MKKQPRTCKKATAVRSKSLTHSDHSIRFLNPGKFLNGSREIISTEIFVKRSQQNILDQD